LGDDDRGSVDSLRAVSVARATVVEFVQREGSRADDCSAGDQKRKRADVGSLQHQADAGSHHDTVEHRDHPGSCQRELPCAGCEPLAFERRRRPCLLDNDEVGLELR
jgi:hypothetical protein